MKSFVFVPSRPKMLAKIPTFEADAVIIDLEDSINEEDKQQALNDACDFLKTQTKKKIYIRVDGNLLKNEFACLGKYLFTGYMLPKFEHPDNYKGFESYLEGREIIALVETPLGIVNLKQIATSPMVNMIAFGAEDFTSVIGMKNCVDSLNFARSSIVTYGKAFGKKVIDTPSFIIDDPLALDRDIQTSVDLGFDGKLAIHPKQVARINELFQYYDLDKIRDIVSLYESSGEAVLRIGDNIYEKMHISHFKRILKEHDLK